MRILIFEAELTENIKVVKAELNSVTRLVQNLYQQILFQYQARTPAGHQ